LLIFADDYSTVLNTTITDEGGIAMFPDVVIPGCPTGAPRYFVM